MTYLITGGPNGWFAKKFAEALPEAVLSSVDIADPRAVATELERVKPDVLINAAGKTGKPNIDWCEAHKEETFRSNVIGPAELVNLCKVRNIRLVHLSSGCIFQGSGKRQDGFREDDPASPPSFYSWTKYWTDEYLMQVWPKGVLIIRLRLPVDTVPSPRNLIDKLAGYPKIIDVENSVTVVPDLIEAVKALIEREASGIFHVTNPGSITHREIMALYTELVDPAHHFEFIREEDLYRLGLATAKRSNCILHTEKLEQAGVHLPPIRERMREVVLEYAKRLAVVNVES